jgi:hypothetical protein
MGNRRGIVSRYLRRMLSATASCAEFAPRTRRAVTAAAASRIVRSGSLSVRASSVKVRIRRLVLPRKAWRSRSRSMWNPSRTIGFGIRAGRETA